MLIFVRKSARTNPRQRQAGKGSRAGHIPPVSLRVLRKRDGLECYPSVYPQKSLLTSFAALSSEQQTIGLED